jgi:hypothetical protein
MFMKAPVITLPVLLIITASLAAEPDETAALRDRVVKADKPDEKAA